MEVSAESLIELAGPQGREARILVIELCGVFWIAAEMLILFFMIEARRHVGRCPIPGKPIWDRHATHRAVLFLVFLLCVLGVVVLRPLFWDSLSVRLEAGPLEIRAAAMHDALAVRRHLAIWAGFVTIWVVLEALIVYQGCRASAMLRTRLRDMPHKAAFPGRPLLLSICILVGVLCGLGLQAAPVLALQHATAAEVKGMDAWQQVLSLSETWLYPYRNAMFLYLRVAGVAWIVVEWVAAMVLWRTWRAVGCAVRDRITIS